jgi:hypothetical protein
MANPIQLIDEYEVTTATLEFTLGGGSQASSGSNATMFGYDIYMLRWNIVDLNADNRHVNFRLTKSGIQVTDNLYDSYGERTRGSSFVDLQQNNVNYGFLSVGQDTADVNVSQGIAYIFHANDATKYTSVLIDEVGIAYNPYLMGMMAGTILKKQEAHDGIRMTNSAGSSFQSGKFKLYGIRT